MSVVFSIENPRFFFKPKRVLTIDECLALSDDLMQVNYDELSDDVVTSQAFYQQPLSKLESLRLTKMFLMVGGFELSFYNNAYHVRINTPATIYDWQQALEFLQSLSHHLNRPIISDQGQVFSADDIVSFDYKTDIILGLKSLLQLVSADPNDTCEVQAVMHPMAFNKHMIAEILDSFDPTLFFSQQLTDNQNIDGYFACPQVTQRVNQASALYVLDENLPTILPYQPQGGYLEFPKIDVWQIGLYALIEEESLTSQQLKHYQLPYASFISQLRSDEYEPIDAKYILVYAMSKARMAEILANKPKNVA